MSYKRILTIQDISCVGQCSLTVAQPILSASGNETCIIPSAVLSSHTAGFKGYTFRDLTEDIPLIAEHWKSEGILFDAIYTGYLGSAKQIDYVKDIFSSLGREGCVTIVDPAMADNGKLYVGFDAPFVEKMKELAFCADIILPNITEACLLTGVDYLEQYDGDYIRYLVRALHDSGAGKVVLTGVSYNTETTGVVVCDGNSSCYYEHRRIPKGSHGTGDVYAAAFTGALANGKTVYDSAVIAAEYTVKCIENTIGDPSHWYGVKFEPVLPYYIELLKRPCKPE
ncbi:MAG: pyridoxamine kinase [Clostridia bacterium]|nr:pyridoxamine kinase [Clostridia bacterium]